MKIDPHVESMTPFMWRLQSVMHQQAKLPEILDQIPQNIRVFWDLVPEHPPSQMKFPESKSDLTQKTPSEN